MYLEFRHLRTIRAIHEAGGLARAADMLNITQSALSHQVKGLEEQVGMELFQRRSKPMKLSPAGMKLLRLAERILPEISAVEEEFRAMQSGRSGRMHIAIECHACFDWLFPVLDGFRSAWPEVDVDIRMRLAFDHQHIFSEALETARSSLEDRTVGTLFCEPGFKVSTLRQVYNTVWNTDLDAGNFQRKVTTADGFLTKLESAPVRSGERGGRPASLWTAGPAKKLSPPISRPLDDVEE